MRWTLILPALLAFAPSQDDKKWAEAMAEWGKYSGSKDPNDRARAVEAVGGATYDKRDKQALQMILAMLDSELARDKQGKKEEEVSNAVLEACVGALKKITNSEAADLLLKRAKNKGMAPRARLYVVWGLAGIKLESVEKTLVDLVDDPQPIVTIAAIDALRDRELKNPELYLRVLKDEKRPWEAKLSALLALGKTADAADEKSLESLLDAFGKSKPDEGRLRDEYRKLLAKLLGVEVPSDDPNAWRTAWAAKKAGKDPAKDGGTVAEPTEFFGGQTKSTRIVFILDRTGSMDIQIDFKEDEKKPPRKLPMATNGQKEPPQELGARAKCEEFLKKYDGLKVRSRMDALKKEFVRTICFMDPKVHFTVIWYEANQTPWKDHLVPATWQNKLDIVQDVDRLKPSGGTNIWGGIELAFKMVEQPNRPDVVQLDKKGSYATSVNGPDTFFLMTDGAHNNGKFVKQNAAKPDDAVDKEAFIGELRKVNRLRKVVINCVVLGSDDHGQQGGKTDPALLKSIADETGGTFTHVKG